MARMLLQTIEQIVREKNIAPEVIVDAVEEAMAVASKKYYKTEEELRAKLNRETGEVDVYAIKQVVDEVVDRDLEISLEDALHYDPTAEVGGVVSLPRSTEELGRIAAQAAKQVIFQKVRDAERENICNEFIERVGELITGIVKRFERGDMIIDLGRAEGLLPRREQSRAEHYNIGDRIRLVIIDVLRVSRGPQIVVSRASPDVLLRLFEMEVPEIYDGTVTIKCAMREAGDRSKVAVHSTESDVDPVGACVGMRGSRVQSIIRELRGEKIDIVQWSPDLQQYAVNSLKPARVNRVALIDSEERHLEVIVDEDQLSLAIGKRGQNVRLAGKLLNCKIDIKGEDDKRQEVELTLARMALRDEGIEALPGVGPSTVETLAAAGFSTVGDVADASAEALMAVPGVGAKTAEKLMAGAEEILGAVPEEPEPAAALPTLAEEVADEGTDVLAALVGDIVDAEMTGESVAEDEESTEAAAAIAAPGEDPDGAPDEAGDDEEMEIEGEGAGEPAKEPELA